MRSLVRNGLVSFALCMFAAQALAELPEVMTPVYVAPHGWLADRLKLDVELTPEEQKAVQQDPLLRNKVLLEAEKRGEQRQTPRIEDPATTALLKRLETADAETLKQVIARWESLVLPTVRSPSGRPRLPLEPQVPATVGWPELQHKLWTLTGESRFGDALEAALYRGVVDNVRTPAELLLQESIFATAKSGDADVLVVNLFETAKAEIPLGGQTVNVILRSAFPAQGVVKLDFRMREPARFAVWVRVPTWTSEMTLRTFALDGERIGLPGDWMRLPPQVWLDAESIELTFATNDSFPIKKANRLGPLVITRDNVFRLPAPVYPKVIPPRFILHDMFYPRPVARPSVPAKPGEPIPPGKVFFPTGERRLFGEWLAFDSKTWTGKIGSDPPGQVWDVRVLPFGSYIQQLAYSASPVDYRIGERVNVFLRAGENGQWGYVSYVQDELMQMAGHAHWWLVRSVAEDGRSFVARLYTAGDNLVHLPDETFVIPPDCEKWREGEIVADFRLKPGDRVRMTSVFPPPGAPNPTDPPATPPDDPAHSTRPRTDNEPAPWRFAVLLTDDASLDAIRQRKQAALESRLLKEGIAGFVDSVAGDQANLTLFSNFWPYCHRLLPDSTVRIAPTGPDYLPVEDGVSLKLVSAKVGGEYSSGDTAAVVKGDVAALAAWQKEGRVVRLVPLELKAKP